jgi:hypothetical protein
MLSLTAGELSFAVLLVALIAAAPWIPRLGEKAACLLAGGASKGGAPGGARTSSGAGRREAGRNDEGP